MSFPRSVAPAAALVGILAGCGDSDPVDVSGAYTINITYVSNGCALNPWMADGSVLMAVPFQIAQDEMDRSKVSGTVQGLVGAGLGLWLGSNVFQGTVEGDEIELALDGRPAGLGNCAYTPNASLSGELEGDLLTGAIRYTYKTNGNPDCAMLTGCLTLQNFNGTRPPKPAK